MKRVDVSCQWPVDSFKGKLLEYEHLAADGATSGSKTLLGVALRGPLNWKLVTGN